TFVSPSFGGGTANVEFEFLTGLSNYFLNNASPYSQTIKKSLPSLFTLFKDKKYLTTVIHPFFVSMYNRQTVYKNFGLDNFITIEDMPNYETAGPYVSDEYFNKEILKQLNSTDQSQFIFALSMQNHVTFKANRYSEHPITFKSSLNSNDQEILQSYVDGINLTDHSYAFLKQELSKSKKPTIIFFFGDHLTFLDSNYNIYKETGFNINDENKKRHTPLAVWSNYKTDINLPQNISPNFLSLEVLKSANITPKYQFSYLNSLISSGTVLNQKLPNKFTSEQLKDYELIQYDLIFGKQYSLKLVKP
ncbi:MAG: LTA synthase family protein, partial [Candidatus Shapirobacteria bacterium]